MLTNILTEKKIILVCGSGGVGKTTTAASIALLGASLGKKTIVLTIDPAKRLATSLGLDALSFEPKKVAPKAYAMMLDTKRTFDQLVIKYSPTKEIEKKILENKIYQNLSNMMAGSQEYMAMEKLFELTQENKYDLIIVDTPPTTHAIDFLEAPDKMVNALSNSMIHLLLKPAVMMGKGGLKFFEKGSQMLLKLFDRITGFAFLQDVSEMLIAFQDLLGGFGQRAAEVNKLLKSDTASFILVTACEEKSIREAFLFSEKLEKNQLPFAGIILNRVHQLFDWSEANKKKKIKKLKEEMGEGIAEKMNEVFENFGHLAMRDKKFSKELSDKLKNNQFLIEVPLMDTDIHSLDGLTDLHSYFS